MKKVLCFLILFVVSVGAKSAQNKNDAVYCWVDGSATCYRLESMPKVTYHQSQALLTLSGSEEPVLVVALEKGRKLRVVYGRYATGVDETESSSTLVYQVGKMIYGGNLIVIKDGKWYDAQGRMVTPLKQDK